MIRMLAASLVLALLAGCESTEYQPPNIPDNCVRATLFQQCLAALPAGPTSTRYNDWDEVVDSCESAAYYQSLRARQYVSANCGGSGESTTDAPAFR